MAAIDYRQDYTWSQFSPVDNTGRQRSIFKSSYKNLRFILDLQGLRVLSDADSSNLPGLSDELYGTPDFWRILLSYNGLVNPIQDVYAGQTLRIPTKASIVRELTQQQNNQTVVLRI